MHCRVITKYATLALRCSRNSRSFAFAKAKPTRPWYVRIELLVSMTIMKSNNLSNYWFIFFKIIVKVDREKQSVVLDEFIEDISVEELQDSLPGHQPRYVIYTYKMVHDDQRISYPMCFIFYTPRDSQIELQMMYACTKSALQREVDLTRVYEIRELDELTEDWLRAKLK